MGHLVVAVMAVEAPAVQGQWTKSQRIVVGVALVVGLAARWWDLGGPGLSFDETFTAAYSGLPINEIPAALRANDSHPPLDYLLRHLFVGPHSELWLRVPSAAFASLALVVVVRWMRRRAWFGVGVVTMFALSPFQLLYGRQARMYALMTLVGVLVAVVAERWIDGDERSRWAVAVGALTAIACLDHAGGLFLAAGIFALPGLRRDPAAWRWRAAPVAAVLVWALLWGPAFLDQTGRNAGLWIPTTTPSTFDAVVDGMVSLMDGTRWIVTALTLVGGLVLVVLDRKLGRVWSALFFGPLVVLAIVGLHYRIVLPRTLAASAWALPVAWAGLVQWCWRRWAPVAVVLGSIMALVTIRSIPVAVGFDEGYSQAVTTAVEAVEPGDALLVHPYWLWPLASWNGMDGPGGEPPPPLDGVDGRYWQRPGAEPTGRTWVVEPKTYRFDRKEWPSCGEWTSVGEEWELGCVVVGGS